MQYVIENTYSRAGGKVSKRRYNSKEQVMDVWDDTVQNTIPGDKAVLYSVDDDGVRKVMSSYEPCDRNRPFA